ncbi:MAG: hypothetical protein FJ284_14920 [Planctomycetes bacterium]|nr:hypothetical protein [Planctomycetota bacterium]
MSEAWRYGDIRRGPTAGTEGSVVKIGGSLLVRPGWPESIANLLADFRAPLVVVGGGGVVEGLRTIDAASHPPAALMHELAIDAMTLSARIVAAMLSLPLATTCAAASGVIVAPAWLRDRGIGQQLPTGWHVTSDSIAAAVAEATGRGLVLAKSVPPPNHGWSLEALATAGWVDAHFPRAAEAVTPIRWAAPA